MHPACVRTSPGKEEECDLKPFIVTQRVRRPPGKGGARQPEASLAWVTATSLVKRRQRVPKPCGKPRNHVSAEAFAVLDPGAASGKPLWPGIPVRPGSLNRAKVRDGSSGNLGDSACVHVEAARQEHRSEQCSRPDDRLGEHWERMREHEAPRHMESRSEDISRRICTAGSRSGFIVCAG